MGRDGALRKLMFEEGRGVMYGTKLMAGDVIRFEKVSHSISFFRPSRQSRLFIEENEKRNVSIDTEKFLEIVYLLAAATGLGYLIEENTEQKIEVLFADPPTALARQ